MNSAGKHMLQFILILGAITVRSGIRRRKGRNTMMGRTVIADNSGAVNRKDNWQVWRQTS
jgi:hypothetical protein